MNEHRHLSFGQFAAGLVVIARERWVLRALVATSGKNNVSLFLYLYIKLVAASGKNNDSLFLHLYIKLVAASRQKRISLANLWRPLARGKRYL